MKWKKILLLATGFLLFGLCVELFYKACMDSGRFEYDLEQQAFVSRSGWDAVGLGLYISNIDSLEDSYLIIRSDSARESHSSLRLDSIPAEYTISCMGLFGQAASLLENRICHTRCIPLLPNSRYQFVRSRGCMSSACIRVRTDGQGRVVEASDVSLRTDSLCP